MTTDDWRVYTRNAARVTTGVIDTWDELQLVVRHNAAGTWQLQMPAEHPQAQLLTASAGVRIYAPGVADPILNGPVRLITERLADDGRQTVTFAGVDDLARLAGRLVWPDPAHTVDTQAADYWQATGAAETVIRSAVNLNAGPGALPDRRIPGLTLEDDEARGAAVTWDYRFANLLDVAAMAANTAGIGFRIVQVDTDLVLRFYAPRDLAAAVRFSTLIGNLRSWEFNLSAPSATTAIVGGEGEGVDRDLIEQWTGDSFAAAVDWGERVEMFVDAREIDEGDTLELRGAEALTEAAATAGMSIDPVDIPGRAFGLDYWVGDTVTVETARDVVTDVVREVSLSIGDQGVRVTPTIGDPDLTSDSPSIYSRVARMARRLGRLERNP